MDTLWIGRSRLSHPSNLEKWKVDSELVTHLDSLAISLDWLLGPSFALDHLQLGERICQWTRAPRAHEHSTPTFALGNHADDLTLLDHLAISPTW